jgi:hypothetical protein
MQAATGHLEVVLDRVELEGLEKMTSFIFPS